MDATTSTALALNLLLRGGAVGALVLLALSLWRDHPGRVAARLGAAAALSIAAATLAAMPGLASPVLAAPASGAMFVFWLFTCALFDDAFRLQPRHALGWIALASLGALHCAGLGAPLAGPLMALQPVVFALLAVTQSMAGWREDLIEGRRRLRSLVVLLTAGYTVAQLGVALIAGLDMQAVAGSAGNAAGTAALSLFVAWRMLRSGGSDLLFEAPAVPAPIPPMPEPEAAPPDPQQIAALEALMTVEHAYREPNLTIGALAERMALPEHKLRRLINQGLGHRNFNAFLNGYRLADARRWLADPAQPDTPILTIAMDAGFQSLGPFNRAFKAETGVTPSEFRRRAAGASLAESEIG